MVTQNLINVVFAVDNDLNMSVIQFFNGIQKASVTISISPFSCGG